MITLIIVNCQYDFISGPVAFNDAKKVLSNIKSFISTNRKNIEKVIFSVDWHPYRHCSFSNYKPHCIQFTNGACIESKLLNHVQSMNIPYEVSTKGTIEEDDQISVFDDIDEVDDSVFGNRYYFDSIVEAPMETTFILCGLFPTGSLEKTLNTFLEYSIVPSIYMNGVATEDNSEHKIMSEIPVL